MAVKSLLAVMLVFAAAAAGSWAVASSRGSEQASSSALQAGLQGCLGQEQAEECARQQVADAARVNGIPATTQALVAALRSDERLGGICHSSLHLIGESVADTYLSSIKELRPLLPACAFGLLHGILDHVTLPGGAQQAAGAISDICRTLIGGSGDKHGSLQFDCAHGSGHALSRTQPGNPQFGYQSCRLAFPETRFRGECFNGVAMRNLDQARETLQRADRASTPIPATVFDQLASVCDGMDELLDTYCAPVLTQPSVETGKEATIAFLDWCTQAYPKAAKTCWSSTGAAIAVISAGIGSDSAAVASELARRCGTGKSDLVDECWLALPNGLTQRGLGNSAALAEGCREYQARFPAERAADMCEKARGLLAGIVEPMK